MVLKLYQMTLSPPVRSILMLKDILNLDMELIEVNLIEKEHLTPEYLEMNPQHTVPTLIDDDFVLWDSHAISIYLVEKYAQNDELYPKDLQKRALINRFLFFDTGVLFPTLKNIFFPIIFLKHKFVSSDKIKALEEAYAFLNIFLKDKTYLAGNLTLADLSCFSTVSCGELIHCINSDLYPHLYCWFKNLESMPWVVSGNTPGLKNLAQFTEGVTKQQIVTFGHQEVIND